MAIKVPGIPDTDLQFVARMLIKTRRGDQVTREESHRLDRIAAVGYTDGVLPASATADEPSEIDRHIAGGGTRAGQI